MLFQQVSTQEDDPKEHAHAIVAAITRIDYDDDGASVVIFPSQRHRNRHGGQSS
jgi:hypothetical protein